jgi:putative NIF3 family GTP cyclohydrolase 1 type 2
LIKQADLIAALDGFFRGSEFPESDYREFFPPGYNSVFERHTVPAFWQGAWNGLMLDNTTAIERVYLCVFPGQDVLDTIIAHEVERGAPGAMIFSHHLADYQETGPGFVFINEPQLDELREHKISLYACHAPLDCHPEVSTAGALATGLNLTEQARFAPYYGGKAGVYGKLATPISFGEFARKAADITGLPRLRYNSLRHNGRQVQQVGIVTGSSDEGMIREALELGCDTFLTGEWWYFGPGEWRAKRRESMRDLLTALDMNLIATSHYASEAVVLRDQMPGWFHKTLPAVEVEFVPQTDPWR